MASPMPILIIDMNINIHDVYGRIEGKTFAGRLISVSIAAFTPHRFRSFTLRNDLLPITCRVGR